MKGVPARPPRPELRILILNWRCPVNPRGGGAEVLTMEIARRLVAGGHSVEWFSASYENAPHEEVIDGVKIVRKGRQWTVHWHAFKHYRANIRERFDLVIDEVNTMPFFTPLWAGIPTVLLIFQLAREVWWYESPFPLSVIGYGLEPLYLALYRSTPALTISRSTEIDLRHLAFRSSITIIPIGIERVSLSNEPKESAPTFIYVGRIAPSKRIDHTVHALAEFRKATGGGVLWLVGGGPKPYLDHVKKLAVQLGVDNAVAFYGRVSATDKHRLMARAHALLMTSVREGWGLVVTESNACGTPAIVYDVPGLRDSVRNEQTGLVVKPNPTALCGAMVRLTSDPKLYTRLVAAGQNWSSTLTFDESARAVSQILMATA